MRPKQSIIIPFHKNIDMLRYCLRTLKRTIQDGIEVIVIGNNYKAAEIDVVVPDWVRYERIYKNLFYSAAINYGVQKAQGEIITFCDPDTFYFDDWYQPLLTKLLSESSIGATSSKLINPLTNRIIDFGMSFTRWNAGHTTLGLLYEHPLAMKDREVQAACSAIMMTRKKDFESVGGMDEDMPYAFPDCDYCLKLAEKGKKTWVLANSQVYHKGHSDPNNSKSYAFKHLKADSKGMFYAKNYHRITEELHLWFAETIIWARSQWPNIPTSYLLLDFSTIYNREYYYRAIENNSITILDKMVVTVGTSNSQALSLYDYVSLDLIDLRTPILYFVDTFISLFNNQLWFRMRDISNDLVIDRHGNVFPLAMVASGLC